MTLVRVVSGHFVAGLIVDNGICVEAAPILRWCVGRSRVHLREQFRRRGWSASVVQSLTGFDSAEFSARAAEKQASRDADARALETGEKTREQLRQENNMFAGAVSIKLGKPKRPY